jgi:hypothetical protein
VVKGAKSIAQYIILKWIDENFIGVETELIGRDCVKVKDRDGESMTLTINIFEDIMNADTREILGR